MTLMREEASSSWQKIQQQNQTNKALYQQLAEKIRAFDPAFVYMVGRGTSDHAGVFARYLIEVELGVVVAAAAPSVASLFSRQRLHPSPSIASRIVTWTSTPVLFLLS